MAVAPSCRVVLLNSIFLGRVPEGARANRNLKNDPRATTTLHTNAAHHDGILLGTVAVRRHAPLDIFEKSPYLLEETKVKTPKILNFSVL